jgi:flagellar biosynthesis protein FlgN
VDPGVCREHLEKLLAEETGALSQLETLLASEHELLVANDVDELERAGDARQACVGILVRVDDERRTLCRMMNLPADKAGLDRLLTWCDPSGALKRRWVACADLATRCRDLNDRNGALVMARLKKTEGLLNVITGRANQPKVYGRQGDFESPVRAARVLATV